MGTFVRSGTKKTVTASNPATVKQLKAAGWTAQAAPKRPARKAPAKQEGTAQAAPKA